jgi:C-terminal processing protease CtpA/Prc
VDFGLVAGTRIGYIYGYGWLGNADSQFYNAIRTLTQDIATDGLIVDFRFNVGGNMFLSNPGLSLLFAQPQPTIGFAIRADPTDHFKMRMAAGGQPQFYVIPSAQSINPVTAYGKPIAVLTGPGAVSSGDQVALRMTYLPNVRTFGKSTATAFNDPTSLNLAAGWFTRLAVADAYRIEAPKQLLTHDEFHVDEPVWLKSPDVASGEDTVVRAAMRWILTGATR